MCSSELLPALQHEAQPQFCSAVALHRCHLHVAPMYSNPAVPASAPLLGPFLHPGPNIFLHPGHTRDQENRYCTSLLEARSVDQGATLRRGPPDVQEWPSGMGHSTLRNGPFDPQEWAIRRSGMGHSTLRNGPPCEPKATLILEAWLSIGLRIELDHGEISARTSRADTK